MINTPPLPTTTIMHQRRNKAEEAEYQMQLALTGLEDGTYMSVDHAVMELGVLRSTLHRRNNGRKSSWEWKEKERLLTDQEEKALVDWISLCTTAGNPVDYRFIKEMAQELKKSRTESISQFVRLIGTAWVSHFLDQHSHLETKISKAVESARVHNVTKEQMLKFNSEFRRVIHENNIKLQNIYNANETGSCSLF